MEETRRDVTNTGNKSLSMQFIAKTYQKVGLGLLVTAITMAIMYFFFKPVIMASGFWTDLAVMVFALILIFTMGHFVNDDSASSGVVNTIYYIITALFGVMLAPMLILYNLSTIGIAIIATAAIVGGLSFYATHTKRDFIGMGTYLFWGLLGVIVLDIIIMIIAAFTKASPATMIAMLVMDTIAFIVILFYVIYDTQMAHNLSKQVTNEMQVSKYSTMAAMSIYMDIIYILEYLIEIIGIFGGDNR